MPKLILFISFYLLCNHITAQSCLYDARWIGNELDNPNLIDNLTSIDIFEKYIIINNDTLDHLLTSSIYFDSNESLNQILNCKFSIFEDFKKMIDGRAKTYKINYKINDIDITDVTYFTFDNYGRKFHFLFLNSMFLYELINVPNELEIDSKYYSIIEGEKKSIDYVSIDQITGSFELIDSQISIIESELVLEKEGYDSLLIIPAEFKQEWLYQINEISTCPAAQFDTLIEQYLYKEASSKLKIIEPEFETVTEQVLVKWSYEGATYYERELFNIDTTISQFIYNFQINSSDISCRDHQYFNCVEEVLSVDSFYNITQIGYVYPACREGYYGAGKYCYTDFGIRPAEYKTRSYEKLIKPPSVEVEEIPAEYKLSNRKIITNKDILDPSCIAYMSDSLKYFKLSIPTTTESIKIDQRIDTHYIERIITPPNFNAIPNNELTQNVDIKDHDRLIKVENQLLIPQYNSYCLNLAILNRMIELELLEDSEKVFSVVYYQAVVDYQIKFSLPIGVISQSLLDHLNILL